MNNRLGALWLAGLGIGLVGCGGQSTLDMANTPADAKAVSLTNLTAPAHFVQAYRVSEHCLSHESLTTSHTRIIKSCNDTDTIYHRHV